MKIVFRIHAANFSKSNRLKKLSKCSNTTSGRTPPVTGTLVHLVPSYGTSTFNGVPAALQHLTMPSTAPAAAPPHPTRNPTLPLQNTLHIPSCEQKRFYYETMVDPCVLRISSFLPEPNGYHTRRTPFFTRKPYYESCSRTNKTERRALT